MAYVSSANYVQTLGLAALWADKGLFDWKDDDWPTNDAKRRMALSRGKSS